MEPKEDLSSAEGQTRLFPCEISALRSLARYGEVRLFGSVTVLGSTPNDLDAALILDHQDSPGWAEAQEISRGHPRLDLFILRGERLYEIKTGLRVGSAAFWDLGEEDYTNLYLEDGEDGETAQEEEHARRQGVQVQIEHRMVTAIRNGIPLG
jgi:hypothetical protein